MAEIKEGELAYGNNPDMVARGIKVRREIVELLVLNSWDEYIFSTRMSGSYSDMDELLTSLEDKIERKGREKYDNLLRIKEGHCEENEYNFNSNLNAWDVGFYNNPLLRHKYGVDYKKILEYFTLNIFCKLSYLTEQLLLSSICFWKIKSFFLPSHF